MAGLTADERAALLESLRRLLADRCAESDVRRIMAAPGWARSSWSW